MLTKASYSLINGAPANVLDFGADPTGVSDSLAAFDAALASSATPTVYVPAGTYVVSGPINMPATGSRIYGAGRSNTFISQLSASWTGESLVTHPATIVVNETQCGLENITINGGLNTNSSDCIQITSGQRFNLLNVNVKFGVNGVKLIAGNLQRWYNVFAETCDYGFVVEPDSGDNTNGCVMSAIGAYGCGVGLYITKGTGASGHSNSNWDFYAEGGENGVYIRDGRYCNYDLYVDSLSGGTYSYDLDNTAPHNYFLKNANNATNGAIGVGSSYAMGINGTGGTLLVDYGNAPSQIENFSSSSSISLIGVNVNLYVVENLNTGAQIPLNLSFLAYTAVGTTKTIIKTDTTGAAFILTPPAGVTLLGDTGVFGSYSSKVLQVTTISSTQAYCKQI